MPDGQFATAIVSQAKPIADRAKLNSWKYSDRRLELVELTTGKVKRTISDEKEAISSPRFADDGQALAYLRGGDIWVMATADGATKRLAKDLPSSPHYLTFATNTQLAAQFEERKVQVWDTVTGKTIYPHHIDEHYFRSAKGGNIAAEIVGNTVRLFRIDSSRPVHAFDGHRFTPLIRYSTENKNMLVSRDYKQAILWNSNTGKIAKRLGTSLEGPETSWQRPFKLEMDLCQSPEHQIYSRRTKKGLELRDALRGHLLCRLDDSSHMSHLLSFSAAGNRVCSGNEYGHHFFDVATGKRISSIARGERQSYRTEISSKGNLFAHYGGKKLGQVTETIEVYEVDSGRFLRELDARLSDSIFHFQFSDDGQFIIAESREQIGTPQEKSHILLWNVNSGKRVQEFMHSPEHSGRAVQALALSPDQRFIAVAPINSPKIEIWEVASGTKRGEFGGHVGRVVDLAFSPDGWQLASSSECPVAEQVAASPVAAAADMPPNHCRRERMSFME